MLLAHANRPVAQRDCLLQEVKARRAEVKKYSTDPVYKKKIDDERRRKKEAEVQHDYLLAQTTCMQTPSQAHADLS